MRTLYLASVWLHILAAMTWLGGTLMFLIAVLPWVRGLDDERRAAFQRAFGPRIALVTWVGLGVLAVTGTFNLWIRGVRLDDVLRPEWRSTSFGQLLMIKLTLVLATVVACLGHQFLRARAVATWLGRLVLGLGLVIVAVAVALVRNL